MLITLLIVSIVKNYFIAVWSGRYIDCCIVECLMCMDGVIPPADSSLASVLLLSCPSGSGNHLIDLIDNSFRFHLERTKPRNYL